ncbi:MAG TPA: hypothetical protein VMW42_09335 [Desulfatiglandales bacterium]|nr:hypothetical protein [Desulfatiglandales bacterium]
MCVKTGDIWDRFVIWARGHGVDFRAAEDYELLWRCYYDATKGALGIIKISDSAEGGAING